MTAGDAYTARYKKSIQGFKRMEVFVDDALLWDASIEENFNRFCQYITKCSSAGITLNEKFCFGQEELD